ncbi:MAG: hypothetical protein ACFHHU_05075 [Porticoccaceae bacterium]
MTISGYDGGTAASPLTSIRYAGSSLGAGACLRPTRRCAPTTCVTKSGCRPMAV